QSCNTSVGQTLTNSRSCNLELLWILARLNSAILTLIIPHFLIFQDGEGNGTVNRRDKQGLQIRVGIREAVGIARLMNDLGIDIPLAVPERLFRRKLRAIVRAFPGKVALIHTDAEISEQRVRVDG